ncbi:MAG: glycosyltransferase family 4 protein [Armatimonadetes bacterium]|nr:glycosyltransferase family 4 protein [Armatimonadota bacterium]
MLVRQFARRYSVDAVAGYGAYSDIAGIPITTCFDPMRPRSILNVTRVMADLGPDWLWVQYNPLSYARRGVNLYLPAMLTSLRRRRPKMRIAVMIHEISIWPGTWKQRLLVRVQERQLAWVCRQSDVAFVPVAPWIATLRELGHEGAACWLPVGSNIASTGTSRKQARSMLGLADGEVVLGLFGFTYHAGLSVRVRAALDAADESGRPCRVMHVGPKSEVLSVELGSKLISEGLLPANEVSIRLSAMDVLLLPYPDGVCGRRTAMMAGFEHACVMCGTRGDVTEPLLRSLNGSALLLSDVKDDAEWQSNVRRAAEDRALAHRLSRAARAVYDAHFTWEVIGDTAMEAMAATAAGT